MLTKRALLLWWALAGVAWAVDLAVFATNSYGRMTQICIQGAITVTLTVWAMLCTLTAEWRRRETEYLTILLDSVVNGLLNSGVLYKTGDRYDDTERLASLYTHTHRHLGPAGVRLRADSESPHSDRAA